MQQMARPESDTEIPLPFKDLIDRIETVAAGLAQRIARNGLGEDLGDLRGANSDGDTQKALDLIADDAFRAALAGSDVRFYASEEQEEILELNPGGRLALAIDPLDGSSNIAVNVSIGTIFAVHAAEEDAEASFLRPGRALLAAGYVIYGPQCCLVASFGDGVVKRILDPVLGRFVPGPRPGPLAPSSREFAINTSNYRHWPRPVRAFIDDCVAGAEGPRAENFNMRWIASLVAETHRIITRGGVFLYPGDDRKGYERGRLRTLYECAPIAFLIEQLGGRATDGLDPILDQVPARLHERTPFVFGCAENVARVSAYHDLPPGEMAALFGSRGLFRV